MNLQISIMCFTFHAHISLCISHLHIPLISSHQTGSLEECSNLLSLGYRSGIYVTYENPSLVFPRMLRSPLPYFPFLTGELFSGAVCCIVNLCLPVCGFFARAYATLHCIALFYLFTLRLPNHSPLPPSNYHRSACSSVSIWIWISIYMTQGSVKVSRQAGREAGGVIVYMPW